MGKTLAIINNKSKRTIAELEQQLAEKTREAQNYREVLEGLEFEQLDVLAKYEGSPRFIGEASAKLIRHSIATAKAYEAKFNKALDALQKHSEREAEELRTGVDVAEERTHHLKLLQ